MKKPYTLGRWIGGILPIFVGILVPASVLASDWRSALASTRGETEIWWRDGFPGLVEDSPWHQCLLTGEFGMVFDMEALSILHLGALAPERDLFQLPPADLSLRLQVDEKVYEAIAGGPWTKHGGPRLVESGRYFQRADVTDLVFKAEDGSLLNVESRLEFSAWDDRLNWRLFAQPGNAPIPPGEEAFGKQGGGYGLTGSNHFELGAEEVPDSPEFTYSFWVFVPEDYQATKISPWLFCRNRNELADGNVGVMIGARALPQAKINIGGGRENAHTVKSSRPLRVDAWNHLLLSYDGETFRSYVNDRLEGEKKIGVPRKPSPAPIAFGRRQDNSGTGYYFRGVVDEIQFADRAMSPVEIRRAPAEGLVASRSFRIDGVSSEVRPRESWGSASAVIELVQGDKAWEKKAAWKAGDETLTAEIALDPAPQKSSPVEPRIEVRARTIAGDEERPVVFDPAVGWHRINLDGVVPQPPEANGELGSNDGMERVWVDLENPTEELAVARLLLEKTAGGIRHRIGSPITGVSAVLRDDRGFPTGIPIQLSKNWHNDQGAGEYAGLWFHGVTQIPLPAKSSLRLELSIVYGHWGGLPAVSHAQLSLIGWGSNQRWDQSALGSWGESICFEPDQIQGKATVTDVRPLMVTPMSGNGQWSWTHNVGGADFFRLYDAAGERQYHRAMRTRYVRQGPCLTEVTYSGRIRKGMVHSITVGLGRTDDLVRGTYRIRLDVAEKVDFSRFVLFQVGADSYNKTRERLFAIGDDAGLAEEWETAKDGVGNLGAVRVLNPKGGWVSLHDASNPNPDEKGAWANRGIVIRQWKARLGGKEVSPHVVEHRSDSSWSKGSTFDVVPPPGVKTLQPGDFVEAVVEHLVIPQSAEDYYGSNEALRSALSDHGNTWKMVHREATGNTRRVSMKKGKLVHRFPDVRIATEDSAAEFKIEGGVGYVPVMLTGLSRPDRFEFLLDGEIFDQSQHGNDFWQADFDPDTATWSLTFNIPGGAKEQIVEFRPRE